MIGLMLSDVLRNLKERRKRGGVFGRRARLDDGGEGLHLVDRVREEKELLVRRVHLQAARGSADRTPYTPRRPLQHAARRAMLQQEGGTVYAVVERTSGTMRGSCRRSTANPA